MLHIISYSCAPLRNFQKKTLIATRQQNCHSVRTRQLHHRCCNRPHNDDVTANQCATLTGTPEILTRQHAVIVQRSTFFAAQVTLALLGREGSLNTHMQAHKRSQNTCKNIILSFWRSHTAGRWKRGQYVKYESNYWPSNLLVIFFSQLIWD